MAQDRDGPLSPARDRTTTLSSRATRIAGVVLIVYVVWYVVDLVVLDRWPATFMELHRWYASFGVRLVFAGVAWALIRHSLDGLRVTFGDLLPSIAERDGLARAWVRFLTMALWVPAAVAIMWPALRRLVAG